MTRMSDLQALFQTVDTLTEDEKEALLEYLQRQKTSPTVGNTPARVLDLHPGAMTMSDDFNDEL
jgi:hypothetical protein